MDGRKEGRLLGWGWMKRRACIVSHVSPSGMACKVLHVGSVHFVFFSSSRTGLVEDDGKNLADRDLGTKYHEQAFCPPALPFVDAVSIVN